jgi:poly-gamma-glutamate synthesis protein (capsule biosynthesis protein)
MERLALVGDVMLGRRVNEALRGAPPTLPWGDVLPLFEAADWRGCNLECVISDAVPARLPDKVFHFRSDARNVSVLKAAGIDVVSNANNHSLDFGAAAMLDMLGSLDRAGIGHAGAGANPAQACRPALRTTRRGTRIAMLACTDNEPDWAAGEGTPGLYHVEMERDHPSVQGLAGRVRWLRSSLADIVIVSMHWGGNWGYAPPASHRLLATELIRSGADVVFGHSCHVFRGVEVFGGGLIVYSAGDFVDDYAVDQVERNDWSFVFVVEIADHGVVRLRLRPTLIRDLQARLATGAAAGRIIGKMRDLSSTLGTPVEVRDGEGVVEIAASRPGSAC